MHQCYFVKIKSPEFIRAFQHNQDLFFIFAEIIVNVFAAVVCEH